MIITHIQYTDGRVLCKSIEKRRKEIDCICYRKVKIIRKYSIWNILNEKDAIHTKKLRARQDSLIIPNNRS